MFEGAAHNDARGKEEIIHQQVIQVSKIIENKAQEEIYLLLKDIISTPRANIYLPPDIAYIEWHNDNEDNANYTQYISDWPIEQSIISDFRVKSKQLRADYNLSFVCHVDCFILAYRKTVILNKQGYSIAAIKSEAFSRLNASLNDLPNLHVATRNEREDWLESEVSPENLHRLIALNHNNHSFNHLEATIKQLGDKFTYEKLLNTIAAQKQLGKPVFTPIKFRGAFVGYNATFFQPITLWSSFKSGMIYNFWLTMCTTALLVILLCYHLFNIIRLVRFFKSNRIRLAKYAHVTNANSSDEIFMLLQYLDAALHTNEQKDSEIGALNHQMTLYNNYDPVTSLPNVEWLKEQITHVQSEFKIDNSLNIYLIEFCPKVDKHPLATDENSRHYSNEIQSTLTDSDRLATLGNGSYGLITTRCQDVNSVYDLLDTIKQRLFIASGNHDLRLNTGIIRVVSSTITPIKLLEKAHIAFNTSCKENSTENYTLFNDSLKQVSVTDSIFEVHMRKAKLSGDITTNYSVIYNLRNKKCEAIEATTVWNKDNKTLALEDFTDEFISCGINIEFGYWKIENCLSDLNLLDSQTNLNLNILIHLNYGQLVDPNLFSFLDVITVKYHILPSRIFFKVNEDTISCDIIGALGAIQALHNNGFGTHVENFGSSYFNTNFITENHISSVSIVSNIIKRIIMTEYDRYMISSNIKEALHTKAFKIVCKGCDSLVLIRTLETTGVDLVAGNLFPSDKSIEDLIDIINSKQEFLPTSD